jgi:2-oxoglutarate/2-oxoacid ferredoxin oxidoreductase subunit beta
MSEPRFPKCIKQASKPSNFCPGCGHSMILKTLGFTLDDMKLAQKTVFVTDIGCSLLAWDYFDVDTFQSHHGRAAVTATGVKRALPKSTVIAYMGDGGGYAIGLHHLIHAAKRNEPMTVILVNNTVFAMTGGQMAPTTIAGEETETTPGGKFIEEDPFFGPELLKGVVKKGAFVARASVDNLSQVKNYLERALENQNKNKAFSFVEILSVCPVNWKKDAKGSFEYLDKLKKVYPTGVFTDES